MFATPQTDRGKEPSGSKSGLADSASGEKGAPTFNSVWNSLALGGLRAQAKLTISAPHDPHEQEADQVAEQVMRTSGPIALSTGETPNLQRKCAACSGSSGACSCPEEDALKLDQQIATPQITQLQRKPAIEEEDEEVKLQTKRESGETPAASSTAQTHAEAVQGGGTPLPGSLRSFFEPRVGRDLSGVHVHTDTRAASAARSVNALAYTVGNDLVFAAGQYAPETTHGQKLIAHELAHVVQQRGGEKRIQRFVACEVPPMCPPRASGEVRRSRTTPLQLEPLASPRFGVLISNFAIDEDTPKPDLHMSMTWINLVAHLGLGAADFWEILGFSDCEGTSPRNTSLRQRRANAILSLIPMPPRSRILAATGAPMTDCIASNMTEAGRSRNRAVLIRRLPGRAGPPLPGPIPPVGPVRPPGTPLGFCVPYPANVLGQLEAMRDRAFIESVWLPYARGMFGADVYLLWRDYLNRPKGASLTPRVFRGAGNRIVDAFRTDPATVLDQGLLYTDIVLAVSHTPEATIPLSGLASLSPPIPLGTLMPPASLMRTINYTAGYIRIPGNIAGGTGVVGVGSSDAGPDLRLVSGSVRVLRSRPTPTAPETKFAIMQLELQVIDAVDFCPGAPGPAPAWPATVPMSRLEATPTEPTYDLPFHVFVDLSGTARIP